MKQPQPAAVLALGFLLFLSANLPGVGGSVPRRVTD